MIYYKLTNISGGLLVCDLNTIGKTLRLQHKQYTTVPESEITPHIWNLIVNYLILCTEAFTSGEEYIPPSGGGSIPDDDDHFGDNTTVSPTKGVVRYDVAQALLNDEKVRARSNIKAQETLIDYTPKLVLSNKTGLEGNYSVLMEVFDKYSVYLVKVSNKMCAYTDLIGLLLKKYDSTSGLVDNFLIADEDIDILTDNGSFSYKNYLFVIAKEDKGIKIKGATVNVSGIFLIYETHTSNNFYYEVVIPEKVKHYAGVSKTVEEDSDDKTLPTTKAVFDFVNKKIKDTGGNINEEEINKLINAHSLDSSAHNDIRVMLRDFMDAVNNVLNSTDVDLDQLGEIVAYIRSNRDLIESITSSKVSVDDIVDDLTTPVSNKVLSAKQGVELKKLYDALSNRINNLTFGGSGGSAENEIIIVTTESLSFENEDIILTISQETADIIANYSGQKPLFLRVDMGEEGSIIAPQTAGDSFGIVQGSQITSVEFQGGLSARIVMTNTISTDATGKIPLSYIPKLTANQLPDLGFYDDVVEGYLNPNDNNFYKLWWSNTNENPPVDIYDVLITGESGKLYVDLHTNDTYLWSGSRFVKSCNSGNSTVDIEYLTDEEFESIMKEVGI